jgi:hypothetical protein
MIMEKDELSVELPRSALAPALARASVSNWVVDGPRAMTEVRSVLEMCVSELVTLAVKHGDEGPLVLRTRAPTENELHVSIELERETRSPCELDADRPGRFAVEILTALTDGWGFDSGPRREQLWFVLEATG